MPRGGLRKAASRRLIPIHPEVFDRLYNDWSTLVKFQRTRGVLRLMAAVIHSLWEKGDRNPSIMPSTIPIDDPRVQFELTRYLSDNWVPVIEKDVDGPNSLPRRIEARCRTLASTLHVAAWLGRSTWAPRRPPEWRTEGSTTAGSSSGASCRGILPIFGDALTSSKQPLPPTCTRMALATGTRRSPPSPKSPKTALSSSSAIPMRWPGRSTSACGPTSESLGDFARIHPVPQSRQDVPDDTDARLVVLSIDHPYSKEPGCPAETTAKSLWESRGNTPRLYRNTLVFLAVDKTRLQDLDEAARRYLAWESILLEKETLDLSPHQVKQAEMQKATADSVVTSRIPEAYQWLLVPTQATPQAAMEWQAFRLSGADALAVRASKKLRNDELLVTGLAGTRLRMELDRVPLWRGENVPIRQLVDDFARYLYLPRLQESAVLIGAIRDGLSLLTWAKDTFAFADSFDEGEKRYRGLRCGELVSISGDNSTGVLVRPDVANAQLEREKIAVPGPGPGPGPGPEPGPGTGPGPRPKPPVAVVKRFHGSVALDPRRPGADAGRINDEVIAHLAGQVGAKVRLTLEIEADVPNGVPEHVVRIVTENCRTLKFENQGFEAE